MKLGALSTITGDSGYGKLAVGIILSNSPLLRFLEASNAFELDATDFDMFPAEATGTLQYRARGGVYNESAITPGSRFSFSQSMMGDAFIIDKTDLADAAKGLRDLPAHIAKKIQRKVRDWAIKTDNALWLGNGSGNAILGLTSILNGVDDLTGHTGTKAVIDAEDYASGDSFDLSTSANYGLFFEALNEWIAQVDSPNAIMLPRKFYGRFTTMAHAERRITVDKNAYGEQVTLFDGIPLEIQHENSILLTEPDANATPVNNTTSMYILGAGESNLSFVTNSGIEWDETDPTAANNTTKQSQTYKWEMRGAWKIENKNSIRRVRRIKL